MAAKTIRILPLDRGFGMDPLIPSVKPGWESLEFSVDWNQNGGCWNQVTLRNFRRADGSEANVNPAELSFDLQDGGSRKVLFNFKVTTAETAKFDVVLQRVDPAETMLIDPGVILQPGP